MLPCLHPAHTRPPVSARVLPGHAGKVMRFVEKPSADDLHTLRRDSAKAQPGLEYLANMGIYVFKREALFRQG